MGEDYQGMSADDLTQLSVTPAEKRVKAEKMKVMRENTRLCEKVYPSREVKSKACTRRLNKLESDDLESAREDLHHKLKAKAECKAKFPSTSTRALKNRKKCQDAK